MFSTALDGSDVRLIASAGVAPLLFSHNGKYAVVSRYPSPKEAREVLLALGLDPGQVEQTAQTRWRSQPIGTGQPVHAAGHTKVHPERNAARVHS